MLVVGDGLEHARRSPKDFFATRRNRTGGRKRAFVGWARGRRPCPTGSRVGHAALFPTNAGRMCDVRVPRWGAWPCACRAWPLAIRIEGQKQNQQLLRPCGAATHFSLLAQRKVGKRKGNPDVPPRAGAGCPALLEIHRPARTRPSMASDMRAFPRWISALLGGIERVVRSEKPPSCPA